MEREFKKLVEEFELANHYKDIACDILKKIETDNTDKNLYSLFYLSIEESISYFCDAIHNELDLSIKDFDNFNFSEKCKLLQNSDSIKNIIQSEINSGGFLFDLENSKKNLLQVPDLNIIASSASNDLNNLHSTLNRYNRFCSLLRKSLIEC